MNGSVFSPDCLIAGTCFPCVRVGERCVLLMGRGDVLIYIFILGSLSAHLEKLERITNMIVLQTSYG